MMTEHGPGREHGVEGLLFLHLDGWLVDWLVHSEIMVYTALYI